MFNLTKQERMVLAFFGWVLLTGAGAQFCVKRFVGVNRAMNYINESTWAPKLDLNIATREELESLPHIGPAAARRIMMYRLHAGGIYSRRDLLSIPGIGPRVFEQVAPYLKPFPDDDV